MSLPIVIVYRDAICVLPLRFMFHVYQMRGQNTLLMLQGNEKCSTIGASTELVTFIKEKVKRPHEGK